MFARGPIVADFVAGVRERPDVPECLEPSLTLTAEGCWTVVAYKYGRRSGTARFRSVMRRSEYSIDATAVCEVGGQHPAPQPNCTCGFHALSGSEELPFPSGELLEVMLFGRILVSEWTRPRDLYTFSGDPGTRVLLFRAECQTVLRAGGRVASLRARDMVDRFPQGDSVDWWLARRNRRDRPGDPSECGARPLAPCPRGSDAIALSLPT